MPGNWNSGRRPMPTGMQILRGKKLTNPAEPKPEAARPDFDAVPDELLDDAVAVKEWARVVPLLRVCGIITQAERPILIALCQQWSQYIEATRNVRKLGLLVKSDRHDGLPTVNPFVKLSRHSLTQCARLWVELGLTPSARSKLTALSPDVPQKASRWGADL